MVAAWSQLTGRCFKGTSMYDRSCPFNTEPLSAVPMRPEAVKTPNNTMPTYSRNGLHRIGYKSALLFPEFESGGSDHCHHRTLLGHTSRLGPNFKQNMTTAYSAYRRARPNAG